MLRKIVPAALILLGLTIQGAAQVPPIIDREMFFGDPEISGAQISPDGKYISFIKPFRNVRNIWVKERSQPFENARPLTADTSRPITSYFWSRDSKFILYVQDKGGDENFRIYAVDPQADGDPVPPSKDLTPMGKVRAVIYDVPRKTPDEIIIGLNDRDPALHDVYRLTISTGQRTLLRKNEENIASWVIDLDGNLRLALRQTDDGGTEILKIDAEKLVSIYRVTAEETASPYRFFPDGNRFYLVTNKGASLDKTQLEVFDLRTAKTMVVERDPQNEVDFGGAIFSERTDELQATYYIGDKERVYPKTKQFKEDFAKLKKAVPEGRLGILSRTDDENLWMVSVSSDVDPGSTYLFDRTTGKAVLLYKSRPNLPTEHLAPVKPIRYKARDGMTIPAYLTLPQGVAPKKLPVIMFIHGGPWARDYWSYNPYVQFFANRGYAVLQPNFRGSTGYGKKFLNAGNKQWGTGAMQHDITDGVRYLIERGIADPKRVGICGGSYGGYVTLAGLAFTPDLYAAGFSIVGPSNIITLLNSIPPYWAPLQKMFKVRVGDKDDPKEREMLERQSPLNAATNIKAPLFVVQGANDPRVKKAESDQIVAALRDLGRQVEYIVAPDEGHGFAGKENRLAMTVAMENFFAKHLGGRRQEDVREDIREKLEAITVDVKTVTMPKRESVSLDETMPAFDGARVTPQEREYTIAMTMMGKEVRMNQKRSIRKDRVEGKEIVRVVDEVTGMMAGSDTLDLDAATVLPMRRSATQGSGRLLFTFKPEGVEGKLVMGAQTLPVSAKLSAPVLAEGSNVELAVCTLPLTLGYNATLEQFDVMGAKAQKLHLDVVGEERVALAGTAFDAFKVTLKPIDDEAGGQTLWITKQDRVLIKAELKLPVQAGGGTVVKELVK
ncbi:MAG: peptidase S9 [Ignavibacteria bacterium]